MKTDYKDSRPTPYRASYASKWKLPVLLSMLAFVLMWKAAHHLHPLESTSASPDWANPEHILLPVAMPQTKTVMRSRTVFSEPKPERTRLWKIFQVKTGDNLANYFQEAGLSPQALHEVLSLGNETQHLTKIYPGQVLKIDMDEQNTLKALHLDIDPITTLMVHREEDGKLISKIDNKTIEKRMAFGGGKILDSLYLAGKQANLDDRLIMELANVFAYDIDFALDIKPNDTFKVLFEEFYVDGVKIGNGPIMAAEFTNNRKQYHAIRYADKKGKASYYSNTGKSLKKAFIRTPVEYTRISSHFNLKRKHPVLHKIRAHKGVDYAAPTGTPVKASGEGKVIFAGKKGGYGNAIILKHGTKYTTLYAHLSKFAKHLKVGQKVRQGQVIGYVGSTGLASGPHLHYEFRINGAHHNPLTVALPRADSIPKQEKDAFLAHAGELLEHMGAHEKVFFASIDGS